MFLDRISISRKLTLAFAFTLTSFAVSGTILFSIMREREHNSARAAATHVQEFETMNAAAAHYDMAQTVRGFLMTGVERHHKLFDAASALFASHMKKTIALAEASDADRQVLEALRAMETVSKQWRTEIGDEVIKLTIDPKTRDKALALAVSDRNSEIQQAFRAAQDKALKRLSEHGKALDAAEEANGHASHYALLLGGLTALVLGLGSALVLSRNIGAPLSQLSDQVRRLAAGDLAVAFTGVHRRDGIGEIADACEALKLKLIERAEAEQIIAAQRRENELERTRNEGLRQEESEKLQQAVAVFSEALGGLARGDLVSNIDVQLHGPADDLRRVFNDAVVELRQTIVSVVQSSRAVDTGSREITSSSDDLSRRTEQQAASLEQTAAALVEITNSVKQTALGAENARDSVVSATSTADRGGAIVAQAIDAMGLIEKSSDQIGQIIGVIDEIAFQTNLLALNAGVEAARAGDAGRGFAVVASEVRALAQRSAEAAKEIKLLISASATQVSQGVKLVHETGSALDRIVKEVAEIKDAVTAIAFAANEQATGLQEINNAVSQMDQITQQNAAMVEEAAASSQTLAGEADKLNAYVARFRIGDASLSVQSRVRAERAPHREAAPKASRTQEPMRKVANGGFVPASAPVTSSRADSWEEF